MAKGIYVGVNGVARKVKKVYIGTGNVARKVKKGYIGVGGVARPFWTGGEVAYYGTATPLSAGCGANAAPAGGYAVFAGGINALSGGIFTYTRAVDAYSSNLVKSSAPNLDDDVASFGAAAGSANYAMFAGGIKVLTQSSSSYLPYVYAYGASLVKSKLPDLNTGMSYFAGAKAGDCIIFAGGYNGQVFADVYLYNASLVRSTSTLPIAKYRHVAAGIGNNAIFAGSAAAGANTQVYSCSMSLVMTRLADLSAVMTAYVASATCVGNYALFGSHQSSSVNVMDVYNSSLVKSSATPLSADCGGKSAASAGDFAFFGGGGNPDYGNGSSVVCAVDTYNSSLVKSVSGAYKLSSYRYPSDNKMMATVAAGDKVLFGGGNNLSSSDWPSQTVDVFTT